MKNLIVFAEYLPLKQIYSVFNLQRIMYKGKNFMVFLCFFCISSITLLTAKQPILSRRARCNKIRSKPGVFNFCPTWRNNPARKYSILVFSYVTKRCNITFFFQGLLSGQFSRALSLSLSWQIRYISTKNHTAQQNAGYDHPTSGTLLARLGSTPQSGGVWVWTSGISLIFSALDFVPNWEVKTTLAIGPALAV